MPVNLSTPHLRRALPILTLSMLLAGAIDCIIPTGAHGQRVSREYQLKAAFLYRFLGFIRWKSERKSGDTREICILGRNPFGRTLERIIREQKPAEESYKVSHHSEISNIGACHILYVSPSEQGSLHGIFAGVRGLEIVTVSDITGFATAGGMIELFIEGNRIRFTINRTEAQKEGIDFSAQLLALSK